MLTQNLQCSKTIPMTTTATALLTGSGVILAAAPTLEMQMFGMSLLGACLGGFIAAAGWRGQEHPVTTKRFVVNAGCGMSFAPEAVRIAYDKLGLGEPGASSFLAGGAAVGIFGVVMLDLVPALINVLVPKWLNTKIDKEDK